MIKYRSTRGDKKRYSFSEVILKGIAQDGGLFVPEKIPKFTLKQLKILSKSSYQERALFILNIFQLDFSEKEIINIIHKAYSTNFDVASITPLIQLKDNQYILELWHGPTSSFKDMALQIMPLFFSEAIKKDNTKRIKQGKKPLRYLILAATSGDTGKAALEGFKDKENIYICVFYPDCHISKLQELQMITQEGANVAVYGMNGDFDAVQAMVKNIFNDSEFNKRLLFQNQTILSSANSINWGRLIPQIIYYVHSYLNLVDKNIIKLGEQADIAVPSGNFGNILAAFYAKKMGLPIGKLVCASNANNVLTEFIQTGVYNIKKRKLVQTPSPSMDILIANNLERLLFLISKSSEKVAFWMNELKLKGRFEVDNEVKSVIQKEFYADWVSNEECLLNIKKIFQESNYLMDPHTSVAQAVAEKYLQKNNVRAPIIICSTAHFAKFAKDIYKAIFGRQMIFLDEFSILKEINKLVPQTYIPKTLSDLQSKIIRYKEKLEANRENVKDVITNKAKLRW